MDNFIRVDRNHNLRSKGGVVAVIMHRKKCIKNFAISFVVAFLILQMFSTNSHVTDVRVQDRSICASATCKVVGSRKPMKRELCHGPGEVDKVKYHEMLQRHSSADKWITLALADQGCTDLAINLYETSIKPFSISNYLIIASDNRTCEVLFKYNINCYVYMEDHDAGHASDFNTKDFIRKMNIRTYMILDALHFGYNVLHTDLDIVFTKNPFTNFDYKSTKYDLAPLFDWSKYNAGFLFVRSTKPAISIYDETCLIGNTEEKTPDQIALNRAMRTGGVNDSLSVYKLPEEEYQCGRKYWEEGQRNFPEDSSCSECVVIHNNWIVTIEAKRYRFKESGMWRVDTDQYYSDPERTYLTFDIDHKGTKEITNQIASLKNAMAIGEILNRTVILPRFRCETKQCTLLNLLSLQAFEKHFPDYRESSFLRNDLVPETVTKSISKKMVILTDTNSVFPKYASVLEPEDKSRGASSHEIVKWFGSNTAAVLRLGKLDKAFCCFSDTQRQQKFNKRVELGFVETDYRQQAKKSKLNSKLTSV